MHLGYLRYQGLARIAMYRSDQSIDIIVESHNPQTDSVCVVQCEKMSPTTLISSAMKKSEGFALHAWRNEANVGVAHGMFMEGKAGLLDRSGVFEGLDIHEITERETIRVEKSEDCKAGLSSVEVALLSRKWQDYPVVIGRRDTPNWSVEWWDNDGLEVKEWLGKRRVTGWTLKYGGSATDCNAALVALLSGQYAGRTGWLLWGSDGGVAISGMLGDHTGAIWMPGFEFFPGRVKSDCQWPPASVLPTR